MAKKKATVATKKRAKKKDAWTKEERAVFAALGVGTGDVALRKFIRGQRKLNQRFSKTLEAILDHLQQGQKAPDKALARAEKINDAVLDLWGDPDTDAD